MNNLTATSDRRISPPQARYEPNEYDTYIDTIDEIENRVVDDDKFVE